MNRTKIEYLDYTWNPITGCLHNCNYCFARRITERFGPPYYKDATFAKHIDPSKPDYNCHVTNGGIYPYGFRPTFWHDRIEQPKKVKKPSRIGVVFMGDLFGDWVPREWIEKVLETVRACPQHTFVFLTKNPKRLAEIAFPQNAWVGTSVENQQAARERILPMSKVRAAVRFISIEPLQGPVDIGFSPAYIDWFIVGAQTGPGSKKPNPKWVEDIVYLAGVTKTPVFLKDNLDWPEKVQEYPKEAPCPQT